MFLLGYFFLEFGNSLFQLIKFMLVNFGFIVRKQRFILILKLLLKFVYLTFVEVCLFLQSGLEQFVLLFPFAVLSSF